MNEKDLPKVQFGIRKRQHQTRHIKTLETELEAKTTKLKEYEELFEKLLDGQDIETVIKESDTAIHEEDNTRYNNCELSGKSIERLASEDIYSANGLIKALKKSEFQVYYQPIVNVSSGKITGMEALLRWHSPGLGMVYPDHFIPLAEETGLIVPIGEWVLHTACAQGKSWQDAGYPFLRLAVNISPVQLQHKSLIPAVKRILVETGFNPNNLELEITEGVVLRNLDYAADTLRRLKRMGIIISVDDFGTGYSSLVYINKLAVDSLKIDQSFISDLDTNPSNKAIISATMAMAHNLDIKVTAEGVEGREQLDFLKQQGCHYYQGYLYSPPVPAEKFEQILFSRGIEQKGLADGDNYKRLNKKQNGGRGV